MELNRFSCIGHLVTKAAVDSGKVESVASVTFRIPQLLVSMFQYDFTHGKYDDTVKAENGKLGINGKPITIL